MERTGPQRRRLINRGDVFHVDLGRTRGSEIRKPRPCVVLSPDELNHHLRTMIIAPMTTSSRSYPWRIGCRFKNRAGVIALDQIRAVDVERLGRKLGQLPAEATERALLTLQEMFSP